MNQIDDLDNMSNDELKNVIKKLKPIARKTVDRQKRIFSLQGCMAIVFSQNIYDVVAVTGLNYNTITSWKFRWKRRRLSYEKQEDIVLRFGFKKVAEFRYEFPKRELKQSIDETIKNKNFITT